jgi:hypothetical protein
MIRIWMGVCLAAIAVGPVAAQDKPPATVYRPAPSTEKLVTAKEMEAVRDSLRRCWRTVEMKTSGLVVAMVVEMGPDGRPTEARVTDKERYARDAEFRLVADTAYRAIMNPHCQPWPLPPEKYASWRTIIFNFNNRDD